MFFFYKISIDLVVVDVFRKPTDDAKKEQLNDLYNFIMWLDDDNLKFCKSTSLVIKNECLGIVKDLFGLKLPVYFTRSTYIKLAKYLYKKIEAWTLPSGTPGIGKTLFIIYWIYFILSADHQKDKTVFFFFFFSLIDVS
jgi:hypothetical protein